MIYSVWNQGRAAYDYFRTSEQNGRVNTPPPRHLRPREHGIPAAAAAWPLPAGAEPIGSGPQPRGRIARRVGLSLSRLGEVNVDGKSAAVGAAVAAIIMWGWLSS